MTRWFQVIPFLDLDCDQYTGGQSNIGTIDRGGRFYVHECLSDSLTSLSEREFLHAHSGEVHTSAEGCYQLQTTIPIRELWIRLGKEKLN